MPALYKRYIPPKATDGDAAPKAVQQPKPAITEAPNKRKRERTEEETAERKAKKLRKKGTHSATATDTTNGVSYDVAPPPSAEDKLDKPQSTPQSEFAHIKNTKKRHKLEKEARQARKTADKLQKESSPSKEAGNGKKEHSSLSDARKATAAGSQQNGVHDEEIPQTTARKEASPPGADLQLQDVSNKRKKRKKANDHSIAKEDASLDVDEAANDGHENKQTAPQPRKRRHKLESVLQEPVDNEPEPNTSDNDHLKKHTNVMKRFKQSVETSEIASKAVSVRPESKLQPQPTILDLAPLPQPEPAPAPEFHPDAGAIPQWIAQPTTVSSDEKVSFESLKLDSKLVDRLSKLGFKEAMPVQKVLLPLLLAPGLPGARYFPGSEPVLPDIAVSAPTGSGKTIAYLLPIIESLRKTNGRGELRALIVVPTRELVVQVAAVADSLARGSSVKVGMATGTGVLKDEQAKLVQRGRSYNPSRYKKLLAKAHARNYPPPQNTDEYDELVLELGKEDPKLEQRIKDAVYELQDFVTTYDSAVDILVSTPGRLLEHMHSTLGFSISHLQWLVLDEADKLLDLQYDGFLETMNDEITRSRNEDEQDAREKYLRAEGMWDEHRERRVRKVILSATMTRDISKLLSLKLKRPQMVVVRGVGPAGGDDGDAAPAEMGAVQEEDGHFELPPLLGEHCVPVGDGSEKPLFLVQLLSTKVAGLSDGKLTERETFGSRNGKSTSSESETGEESDNESTSASQSSNSDSDVEREGPSTMHVVDDVAPEHTSMHPSRAAVFARLSQHRNAIPTILIFVSSNEATTRLAHLLRNLRPDWSPYVGTMTRADTKKTSLPHNDPSKPLITISTDRAARGLDALGSRDITHVVQYDVPRSATAYVHRVGRTARAGKQGEAWTLYTHSEARWFMKEVARTKKIKRAVEVEKVKVDVGDDDMRDRLIEVVHGMRDEVFGKARSSRKR
jgi:ATP-dependent RNA helicase DDX51/DBP6